MTLVAGILLGSTIYSAISSSNQNSRSQKWAQYNAKMQYGTSMNNISAQVALASVNARMQAAASQAKQLAIKGTTELNAKILSDTMDYNDLLFDDQLAQLWDGVGLDLKQLQDQRATERGGIIAQQAASGTVIGEGSNKDTIIHQMTQEAMDEAVVQHGADLKAAKISNAKAQSRWQGEMEIKKLEYEGALNIATTKSVSDAAIAGENASAKIKALAGGISASNQYTADINNAKFTYDSNRTKITNNLISGVVGAGVQGYSTRASLL